MFRLVAITLVSMLIIPDMSYSIDCFHCSYDSSDSSSSRECTELNTTVISDCEDSTACMKLAFEDPATGETEMFFLDCGSTECDEFDVDGVETVVYNSSFRNYTKKKTCYTEDYGNCESDVCNEAKEEHLAALAAASTLAPGVTTPTASSANATVDCFRCAYIPQIGAGSQDCVDHKTTEHVQCAGYCMKLTQQYNNGSTDYIVYTLDCGGEKCNADNSDGVERSSIDGEIVEKVTCCADEFCNCNSPTCLESIGVESEETTKQQEATDTTDIMTTEPFDFETTRIVTTEPMTYEATTEPFNFKTTDVTMEVTTEPYNFETTAIADNNSSESTSPSAQDQSTNGSSRATAPSATKSTTAASTPPTTSESSTVSRYSIALVFLLMAAVVRLSS